MNNILRTRSGEMIDIEDISRVMKGCMDYGVQMYEIIPKNYHHGTGCICIDKDEYKEISKQLADFANVTLGYWKDLEDE